MLIILNCKSCKKEFCVTKDGSKGTNGAFILKHTNGSKVINRRCDKCAKNKRIAYYKTNKNIWRNYEKKPDGFIMRLYRNMKSRITGVQKQKHHLYKGKSLLSKEEFYKWAKSNNDFKTLFKEYVKSNYDRKLAPSVDRIDSKLGYEINNMEFVTHSENSRRGSNSKVYRPNDHSCSKS